jgi:glycosyltransferase involved in cell wall biosynthesis
MQRLLIAIPVLNEEVILDTNIRKLSHFVQKRLPHLVTTIVIVDNGSDDATRTIGEALAKELPNVTYRRLEERGKGLAIRTAWQEYSADIYAFMDADLSTDLEALPRLIEATQEGSPLAIGSRFHKKSNVRRSIKRRIFSWGYRILLHTALETDIKDLPCGFKAATSDAVRRILPLVQDNNWFFDTEFIIKAEQAGLATTEIPITWTDSSELSRVSKVHIFSLVREYIQKTLHLRTEIKQSDDYIRTHFLLNKKDTPWIIVFALTIALFYGNTLGHGFVHDDLGQIVDNKYVHSIRYIGRAFTGCIWEGQMSCASSAYYRPLHNLSYIFTDIVSSTPGWYHFINLIYFLIAASLVFAFARYLTRNSFFASTTALLFIAHPINTEVVNWVACVPEFLVTIFSLLGIAYYIRYRSTATKKYLWFAIISYFLGLLSKETAASLPIIFLCIDYVMYKKTIRSLWRNDGVMVYGLLVSMFGIYFLMRAAVLGSFGVGAGHGRYGIVTSLEAIYAYITLFGQYLYKLIAPWPLLAFYPFEKSSNLSAPLFLISAAATIAVLLCTMICIYKKRTTLTIAFLWIPIFLLPVLLFFNKIGENVFAERYLFLPSVGFSMILASGLTWLWQKNTVVKIIVAILFVALMGVAGYAVHIRNHDWVSDESFYIDAYTKNPKGVTMLYNLANGYLRAGDTPKARAGFLEVIEKDPHNINIGKAYNNLGMTVINTPDSNHEEAIPYFQKALEVAPEPFPDPYTNLGTLYIERKQYLKALQSFCKASILAPDSENTNKPFKALVEAISVAKKEKYSSVYIDLLYGEAFKKSDEKAITFDSGGCDPSGCYYVFTPHLEQQPTNVLLTFLTMANTQPDGPNAIPIRSIRTDHKENKIIVETDPSHLEKKKTFIFPSCDGVYYEVPVVAN